MKIIALSGKAETGKDYIYNKYFAPLGYKRWALADHFKIWTAGRGLATYEEVFHTKPPHVRTAMQKTGTEEGRNIYGIDIWCKVAELWMKHLNETWGIETFGVTDVRFPNEVEFIQGIGGKVFRLVAPERANNNRLTLEERQHPSETSLDDYPLSSFSGIIYNDYEDINTVPSQMNKLLDDHKLRQNSWDNFPGKLNDDNKNIR